MSARSVLMAIVLSVWLVIGIFVFITVAYVGFIGVGVVGLVLLFVCTLVDLDADRPVGGGGVVTPGFLARQVEVAAAQRPEERASWLADRLLSSQSVRFYKLLGAALAAVGLGGFLLFQV